MATLQKFKLLATQCAVAESPTRSPSASPVIQLRRRKTLRMLLRGNGSRRLSRREDESTDRLVGERERNSPEKKETSASQKLRDLFVSSPPSFNGRASENGGTGDASVGGGSGGAGFRRSLRPLSATFRQRLLRRAWRPVLVAIPE